ncbi:hypothetical protein [Antarctobacter jejuensis]|uniref:hypothetical protein n=1 Tax=Antarctobacter jejuensis TaxID=1439938 RepID=UPI003FD300EF
MTLTEDWLLTLGIASIVVSNLACLPYIRDMLTGATRPMRSTWLIWSVLSGICLLSNIEKGAEASLFFVATETAETVLIFLLAIRFGMGSLFHPGDLLVYACAGAGLILWSYTEDAVYALAIAIAISALGGALTVIKTYRAPRTETAACWILSAVSALLGSLAVGEWSVVLLAYPVYLLALYCAILAAMALGYRRERMEREALALRLAPLPRMPSGTIQGSIRA